MTIRTYEELRKFKTFDERYEYLRLNGIVGDITFGFDRYLNQLLYTSKKWKQTRDKVIIRDEACDLGVRGYDIYGHILVHHMNPITIEDVEQDLDIVYDPEFLISSSMFTHNAIHYGDKTLINKLPTERKRNDTCPWR